MTVAIETVLTYPKSDTATGNVNDHILKQELEDASLSVDVDEVVSIGTNVRITLGGLATTDDVTGTGKCDDVIAAHQGDAFEEPPMKAYAESETSDDSGDAVEKVSLSVGPLAAGNYIFGWFMEHSTTTNTGTSASKAIFGVTTNGGAEVERAEDNNGENQYKSFAGSLALEVNDGNTYDLALYHERFGVSGNASKARRARITVVRV